jgi:Tol biopolymer transport system component
LIAFVSDAGGVPQVWVKNLAEGEPIQITSGDVPAQRPCWSAKNDQIVFARRGEGIWSVPPLGGPARQILERGRNPSFSADGERLTYEIGKEIWIANADGGGAYRLEGTPPRYYTVEASPAFSPDSRQIAFFHATVGPNGDLWVIPVEGGEARQLTSDMRIGGTPVWARDGRSIVFSSERAGSRTLWRVYLDGRTEPVTTGAGEDSEPALSADGKKLIYTNVRNNWTLTLLDPRTGERKDLLERRAGIMFPVFSPDGDAIAFFHTVGADAHILSIGADGRNLRQLTRGARQLNTMPHWSGDGSFVFFYQLQPTHSFRKVPVGGGEGLEVAPWSWETHNAAQVDARGRFAVYTLEENGQRAALVRDLDSGRETALALPLLAPQWSSDGASVLGGHRGEIAVCPADGGDCDLVTKGVKPVWSGDGSRIFFLDAYREQPELWSVKLSGEDRRKFAVLGPFRYVDIHFDVSPSDQIVYSPWHEGRYELWLAELP